MSLFNQNVDSVCLLLSQTFKDKSADEYKRSYSRKTERRKSRYFSLHKNVPYDVVTKMKTMALAESLALIKADSYKSLKNSAIILLVLWH
jgi:hypothetical protein